MKLRDLASEKCAAKVTCLPVGVPKPVLEMPTTPPGVERHEDITLTVDRPVEAYVFPTDGNHPFTEKVLQSAVAKVDAIRDQALALGWSEARLYQNRGRLRFPFGGDYGLVCFIGEEQRVGEVTKQHVEILVGSPPRESRLRFYNPDVDQPWLLHVPLNRSEGPLPS